MERGGGDAGDNSRGGRVSDAPRVPGAGGGGAGGGAWLRGRGWKRVAIAGAAISSAPLVLPPLLLLSAVGAAFSVPLCVFLAGYACTDKIMRSLLPSPSPPPAEGGEEEEQEEEGEEGGEFRGVEADEGRTEMGMAKQEVKPDEEPPELEEEEEEEEEQREEKQTVEGHHVSKWGEKEERCAGPPPTADQVAVSAASDGEEKGVEEGDKGNEGGVALACADERRVSGPEEEVEENQVEEEEVKEGVVSHVGADEGGIPTRGRGPQQGHAQQREEKQVEELFVPFDTGKAFILGPMPVNGGAVVEKTQVEEVVVVEEEKAMISAVVGEKISTIPAPEIEGEHAEERGIQGARDQEGKGLVLVERVERESAAVPEGEEHPAPAVTVTVLEHDILIEPSSLGPEYTNAFEERLSDAADAQSAGSGEHPELQHRSSAVGTSLDSDEDLYNEEKIWEQIDAIRTIVGCKAPPQSSCIEELKALCLLIGLAPAVSFEESSGLEDVNDKLRFLKSIIGVK